MKRSCLCLLLTLFLALTPALADRLLPVPAPGAPLFSNLADEESLLAVSATLKVAGMNAQYVDSVADWVRDYNALSAGNPAYSVTIGFQTMSEGAVDYGEEAEVYSDYSRQWWDAAGRSYADVLGRSTAFFLLRDQIAAANPLPSAQWDTSGWLTTDLDAISSNPALFWEDEQTRTYFTLFNPVEVDPDASAEQLYAAVRAAWSERGIAFPAANASLVTLWLPAGGLVAPAHAAVLIALEDGDCLLFEKYASEYPYQATLFHDEGELRAYFDNWIRLSYRGYAAPAPVLLLKNDQLL